MKGKPRQINSGSGEWPDLPLVIDVSRLREIGYCRYRFVILVLLSYFLILISTQAPYCRAETVMIQIQSRSAAEALPAVRAMLSPKGNAVADKPTNSLIITDNDEVIQNIRAFLARYDKAVQQVRVRVRFHEAASSQGRSIAVEGGASGKHWSATTGRSGRDGVHVHVDSSKSRGGRRSEYFVNVASGSPAYIVTGRNILFRERWVYLTHRYSTYGERIVSQRIETGMDVTPVIVGNRAHIEITPRISHVDGHGHRGVIRFTGASTTLTVPLAQWVTIGGTDQQQNEVIRAILESGSRSGKSSLSISLMVETY
jgi:type II secretory pathway component GspD/PulD (secretin)